MSQIETVASIAPLWIEKSELEPLISLLWAEGYTVVGPRIDQGAIVYKEVSHAAELPIGWTDQQQPGKYQLVASEHESFFEYNVGPQSWKQFFFPPQLTIETARFQDGTWRFRQPSPSARRYALLGVRACELAAIRVQDRVMMDGPYVDPEYVARRSSALIIAVNCTVAAATCFCTSMETGPRCSAGFDLALTETDDGFVLEIGSETGRFIAEQLSHRPASAESLTQAERLRGRAEAQISKRLDTDGIRDLLLGNLDHPHWDKVATRCLSCANCTMVCPTCFCSTVHDVSDLSGQEVERHRSWDSCFNLDFAYSAGGTARNSIRSRYRQWLTHKLASWHDQFDSSGCVGCGRCITWCPVGIDLTDEVEAIRQPAAQRRTLPITKPIGAACKVRAIAADEEPVAEETAEERSTDD
jgi:formate hydrogenlyase subunit 6/NADH:ubiquinone oxidoreductase subunit I